jgi:o-succinylbenzoate---CoA ligase
VRRLRVVDAGELMPSLPTALDGTGPAVLPLPSEPGVRAMIVDTLQLDVQTDPLEGNDIALVVATSGSSGSPKGVMLTASSLLHSAHAAHQRLGGAGQWLLALPSHHIAGVQVLVRSIVARTDPVVMDLSTGFSAAAFVAATGCLGAARRYTSLVPTQFVRLLDGGAIDALRTYDAVLVGGAAPFPTLIDRARRSAINVVVTYGMSETCGGCVYDGRPLDDVSASIDGDGRIVIGGPTVFAGYLRRPDLTAHTLIDGHVLTQDRGRFDASGRLEVLGRIDEIVVSGGENVSLQAVEAALNKHPGIAEAAAIAIPDDAWGQRVIAFVVARTSIREADVQQAIAGQLGRASAPRDVIVVDNLPRTGPGKVDRRALLARATKR